MMRFEWAFTTFVYLRAAAPPYPFPSLVFLSLGAYE